MFLNKTPPAWAKGLFITIKDLCTVTRLGFIIADEFVKSHTPHKHIHNHGNLDYLQILKLIPKDWQNKIKQNTALSEQDTVKVMVFFIKKKMARKEHGTCQWNKYEDWQQQNYTQKLTQKQWEQLFLSLYKNTKEKEAFDIQYKFLHFAQPYLPCLREIGQNYGSIRMHQV